MRTLPGLPDIKMAPVYSKDLIAKTVDTEGGPLNKGERGIILSSPIALRPFTDVTERGTFQKTIISQTARPDLDEINRSVLMWDALHLPEEYVPSFSHDPNIQMLVSEGIARRFVSVRTVDHFINIEHVDEYTISGGTLEQMKLARLALFDKLEAITPGQWAMSRGPQSPLIDPEYLEENRGILVKMTNMLPVPTGDVPLEDVLGFREKRRAELLELRYHITDLFGQLHRADIDEMVEANILEKFEREIEAYRVTLSESKLKSSMIDLVANMNVAAAVITGVGTFLSGGTVLAVALTATGAALSVEAFSGLRKAGTTNPFEYVGKYHSELPWLGEK